uniref:Secreted protein n=1 Tax=Guillardia theta TaxID=55529 RepID=A0A6U5XAD9_GUITH
MKICLLCMCLRWCIVANSLYMTGKSVHMPMKEKLPAEDTRHSTQLSRVQISNPQNLVQGRTDARWPMALGKQDCILMLSEQIFVHMEETANVECAFLHTILKNFVLPNRDQCSNSL